MNIKKMYFLLFTVLFVSFSTVKAQQQDLYAQEALQEVINILQHEKDYIAMKGSLHYFHQSLYNQKRNGFGEKGQAIFNTIRQNIATYPKKVETLKAIKSEKITAPTFVDYKNQTVAHKGTLYTYILAQNSSKKTTFGIFFSEETPTQPQILRVDF